DTLVRVHEFENPFPEEDAPGHTPDQDGRARCRVRRKEQPVGQSSCVHVNSPFRCLSLTAPLCPACAVARWDLSHFACTDRGSGTYIPSVVLPWSGNKPAPDGVSDAGDASIL